MISVFYTSGDGSGWAIDEDLRQIRESLRGHVRETSLAWAKVVHCPFWMALPMHADSVLQERFVIAHADNPPFFYLKQPEFIRAQEQVDLWVARSREAEEQFRALRLPVQYIPYTIDPGLFFSLTNNRAEKAALRKKHGLPEDAYLISNFHRDSEGANLHQPKLQKAPELLLMVLQELKARNLAFHVLLAGPRRHWLRRELTKENIPFTFIGRPGMEDDDFGVNILSRPLLNELYNASDLYLIPSRWEGGPQSIMEAAACRCKILSTPLGVARDILEPQSLFRLASQAAATIQRDMQEGLLDSTIEPQFRRWKENHTTSTLADRLRNLYGRLPSLPRFSVKTSSSHGAWFTQLREWRHTLERRLNKPAPPSSVCIRHTEGKHPELDAIMNEVKASLQRLGIGFADQAAVTMRGWQLEAPSGPVIQFISPDMMEVPEDASVIAPSVQDIVNLRSTGCLQPAVVIPFIFEADEIEEVPLVVKSGDRFASMAVWRALLGGRSVLYPEVSAYYEQVFHAGISWREPRDIPALCQELAGNQPGLRSLARPPRQDAADHALARLLQEVGR